MKHTSRNSAMTMVVALSYSSRWEITKACKAITKEILAKSGNKSISKDELANLITEENINGHLETAFMPDPDLLIRTGGELRISNYMLWQLAYSELYFCNTYWPDFDENDLHKAISSFQNRQRRFGRTEKQVENEKQDTE